MWSDMKAVGRPGPDELAILEPFRGKVPDEVFGEPFVPPVSDGSGQDRMLLRKASTLLQDAGYAIKDGKRTTPQGDPLVVEFLIDDPVSITGSTTRTLASMPRIPRFLMNAL
jgi:microcin C transport system substrate-binding protein